MGMKNKLALFALSASVLMGEFENKRVERKELEIKKKQGLKEFYYGDKIIYAMNKKNADRKAKNKGYI